jgi:hypothetical protein
LLNEKVRELLAATPETIQTLTLDIQKLRVAVSILREQGPGGETDPSIYKDMALLNRLISGQDLESTAQKQAQEKAIADAAGRLEQKGISPASAGRILKVLSAVMAGGRGGEDEPDEPSEPAGAGVRG